jgi:glycosyltransferase involved in cell wall biosynthesis
MFADILKDPIPAVDVTSLDSVLLVTPRWTRDGGVGTHVEASAHALAQRGLRVEALAAQVDDDRRTAGVNIFHQPELFNSQAAMEVRVGEALARRPAVIHLHQVDDPELVDFLRTRAPVVISAHGYTACPSGVYYFQPGQECTRAIGPMCIPNMLLRGCAHTRDPRALPAKYAHATRALRALERADLTVAYSTSVDRHLAANGLTRRAMVPLFTTMDARTGSGHDSRRRVVFAGRVVKPKGVDVLIRAAREVDGEFVICGDGRRLGAMRELARTCGVADRIGFRGWLAAQQLAEELAQASVVVIPSLWPEPFGLVGIEALAAGRPVVASATGGVSDWLEDGVSGTLVPPGDAPALARALNELLEDPELQRSMGAAGRKAVESRFSRERHVTELVRAYATARAWWKSQ